MYTYARICVCIYIYKYIIFPTFVYYIYIIIEFLPIYNNKYCTYVLKTVIKNMYMCFVYVCVCVPVGKS